MSKGAGSGAPVGIISIGVSDQPANTVKLTAAQTNMVATASRRGIAGVFMSTSFGGVARTVANDLNATCITRPARPPSGGTEWLS